MVSNLYLLLSIVPTVLPAESDISVWRDLIIPLIVVVILVVANGFFVAAEFAVLGTRETRMEQISERGDKHVKSAKSVLGILRDGEKKNSYLATAQLGITIVTLILAAYGEPHIAHYLEATVIEPLLGEEINPAVVHTVGYVVALGLLTYVHVVIGEMVPKSLALSEPTKWALRLQPAMNWLQMILTWPIRILNKISEWLLQMFGVPPAQSHARLYSADEIELLINQSSNGSTPLRVDEEIINNIFDFSEKKVVEVMTPRNNIQGLPLDISNEELTEKVITSHFSRFPVYNGDIDHVVGILHLKDLIAHSRSSDEPFDLATGIRSVPIVPEGQSATELLASMKSERIHMAIVLDEYGGVKGIVTLEDLIEEIVGEVRDEYDSEESEPLVKVEPGVIEVRGEYQLAEFIEDVDLGDPTKLPDVLTIGGMVTTKLGRPPQIGDKVILENGVHLTVKEIKGKQAKRLHVEYPLVEQSEED